MMKKVISLVLALAMVASLLCTAVFAAGSKTILFEVTEDSEVTVTETEVEPASEEEVNEALDAAIEAAAASTEENPYVDPEVLETASTAVLTLVTTGDYTAKEGKEYPCEITIYGEGTEDWDIIVMALYEGAEKWEVVYAGKGGESTFEAEAAGTFALYVVNMEE